MIKCPFCTAKSGKFFSICNHIIACFEENERNPVYVNDNIVVLVKKEGFPIKCLRDFFRHSPEIHLRKVEEEGYEVFYAEDRELFIYNFNDYLIETSFTEIKINLRNFYCLISFLFDKPDSNTIIRPSFEPPWFLNLDFNNLPNKFIKDSLKEILRRKNSDKHDSIFDKEYMSKERLNFLINNLDNDPEANQDAKDILYDVMSFDEFNYFDFSKWIINYAKNNYALGSDLFSNLFREIEIGEVMDFLKRDIEEYYSLPIHLSNLIISFEQFDLTCPQ